MQEKLSFLSYVNGPRFMYDVGSALYIPTYLFIFNKAAFLEFDPNTKCYHFCSFKGRLKPFLQNNSIKDHLSIQESLFVNIGSQHKDSKNAFIRWFGSF